MSEPIEDDDDDDRRTICELCESEIPLSEANCCEVCDTDPLCDDCYSDHSCLFDSDMDDDDEEWDEDAEKPAF